MGILSKQSNRNSRNETTIHKLLSLLNSLKYFQFNNHSIVFIFRFKKSKVLDTCCKATPLLILPPGFIETTLV